MCSRGETLDFQSSALPTELPSRRFKEDRRRKVTLKCRASVHPLFVQPQRRFEANRPRLRSAQQFDAVQNTAFVKQLDRPRDQLEVLCRVLFPSASKIATPPVIPKIAASKADFM
jgi:hypothetical protein